jgi:hypothetical protein
LVKTIKQNVDTFVDITSPSITDYIVNFTKKVIKYKIPIPPRRIWINDPLGLILTILYRIFPETNFILVTPYPETYIFPIDYSRTHVFSNFPDSIALDTSIDVTLENIKKYMLSGDYWWIV